MKIVSIAAKPGQNRLNRRLFLAKRRKTGGKYLKQPGAEPI
jgi:hypothetical protein